MRDMSDRESARIPASRLRAPWARIAGVLLVAALAAAAGNHYLAPSPSTGASTDGGAARIESDARPMPPAAVTGPIPDGTTPFDEIPGVADLDPALLRALRLAATDAAHDGVGVVVTSGRRSPEYQERLLQEAIAEHGSREEAARWVATPRTSAHVSGDAVDIGPQRAMAWMSEHGARYGLCRIYDNEPWHYELRPDAAGSGCPPTYADPTEDPRMRG